MFLEPLYFALLVLIPTFLLLFFWRGIARTSALRRMGDEELVRQLTAQASLTRRRVKALLWLMTISCVVIALARPTWGSETEIIRADGQQIIFAVDVSRSMDASDIVPSRLERAKLDIRTIMQAFEGNDFAIVLFARSAIAYMPLTRDISAAEVFVESISTNAISAQGTNLPAAFDIVNNLFDETVPAQRIVIVISDGENHEGDPLLAAQEAANNNMTVHVLGYGSEDGAEVPLFDESGALIGFRTYEDNTPVITRLNEDILRQIARVGGGTYRQSQGSDYLTPMIDAITALQSDVLSEQIITRPIERAYIIAGFAAFFLMFEILLAEARRRGN